MFSSVNFVLALLLFKNALNDAAICPNEPKQNKDHLLNHAKALVVLNSAGNGFSLTGCATDPKFKLVSNDLSDANYCKYCMYTTGKCNTKNSGAIPSSYIESLDYPGYRLIASNGIPTHCFNASVAVCEKFRATLVPVFPRVSSDKVKLRPNPAGHVGFLKNGGYLVNDLSFEQSCGVPEHLVPDKSKRDVCGGHSYPTNCMYHYHGLPGCWPEAKNPRRCELLGFMHDGIPIYGYCSVKLQGGGKTVTMTSCYTASKSASTCSQDSWKFRKSGSCNLDKANGFYFADNAQSLDGNIDFYKGQYGYFFSEEFPFTPLYYAGETTSFDGAEPGDFCGLLPNGIHVAGVQTGGFYQTLCTQGSFMPSQQAFFSPFQGKK